MRIVFKVILTILVATNVAWADGVEILWGQENVFPITVFKADGSEREEAPTIADGDCTLSKDGTESNPTLSWTDTGDMTKVTLSASDSELTHGVLACEDASATDTYLAFKIHLNGSATSPDGTAQAGAASTVTLASAASSTDNAYNGFVILVIDGPGIPKQNCISDYTGSTRVATVTTAWDTQPTSATKYALIAVNCS